MSVTITKSAFRTWLRQNPSPGFATFEPSNLLSSFLRDKIGKPVLKDFLKGNFYYIDTVNRHKRPIMVPDWAQTTIEAEPRTYGSLRVRLSV